MNGQCSYFKKCDKINLCNDCFVELRFSINALVVAFRLSLLIDVFDYHFRSVKIKLLNFEAGGEAHL